METPALELDKISRDLPEPRKFHDNWFLPREPDQVVYMTEQPVNVKTENPSAASAETAWTFPPSLSWSMEALSSRYILFPSCSPD